MFRPRDSYDQRLLEATLVTDPTPAHVRWIHDVFGNCVAIIDISGKSQVLRFDTRIRLDHVAEPIAFRIDDKATTYPFAYDAEEMGDLKPTIRRHYPDTAGRHGAAWRRECSRPPPDSGATSSTALREYDP